MTLIERIEAAKGPSEWLDFLIWHADSDYGPFTVDGCGRLEATEEGADTPDLLGWREGEDWEVYGAHKPDYTASIDAAMTLADGLSEAQIWTIWNDALTACSCAEKDIRKDLARYWCAAALKAQEQTDEG